MNPKAALVIEDDVLNNELLRRMVNLQRIRCFSILSPADLGEILLQIDGANVELVAIFLDLDLPVKSGFDVFLELKQLDQCKQVPIIACSSLIEALPEVRRKGFDGFLGKPFSTRVFPQQMQQILAKQPVWKSNR